MSAARAGGGNAIPVGRAGPAARGLATAAMRLDHGAVRELIRQSLAAHGAVPTWTDLLCPVLIGIGERHAATQRLVEVEHLLSRCITEALGSVSLPGSSATARVLLACADEEQHSLPLEAVAAALTELGIGYRLLGARVPPTALLDAVQRTSPLVVLLWSQTPETGDPQQLQALLALPRRRPTVLAAGPGWHTPLPEGTLTPRSLPEALAQIQRLPVTV
jgi:hypothetical protein